MRVAAAKVTAEASSTAVAPARSAASSASKSAAASSASTVSTSASRSLQPRSGGRGQRLGSSANARLEQRHQVDRISPGVALLHALGGRQLRRQRREHRLGLLPAGQVERLQRLVGEVEHVADLEVAVVGAGGEQHVGELLGRGARPHGRDQRPLGALGVAHLDEARGTSGQPRRARRRRRAAAQAETAAARRRSAATSARPW